jgi:hypothetical protein
MSLSRSPRSSLRPNHGANAVPPSADDSILTPTNRYAQPIQRGITELTNDSRAITSPRLGHSARTARTSGRNSICPGYNLRQANVIRVTQDQLETCDGPGPTYRRSLPGKFSSRMTRSSPNRRCPGLAPWVPGLADGGRNVFSVHSGAGTGFRGRRRPGLPAATATRRLGSRAPGGRAQNAHPVAASTVIHGY